MQKVRKSLDDFKSIEEYKEYKREYNREWHKRNRERRLNYMRNYYNKSKFKRD